MQLSLIIPTLNRQEDLSHCLQYIVQNTLLPDEVIIVEQGNVEKTQQVCEKFNSKVKIEVVSLEEKSLCRARNVGIDKAKGEFILFLDDDSTIHEEYIQRTIDKFKAYPSIQCAFGKNISQKKVSIFVKVTHSFFGMSSLRRGFHILRSGANSMFNPPPIDLNCQWAPGCVSYRKEVFERFRFNEYYIRYCIGEDVYFSHQVYKHYGKGSIGYFEDIVFAHEPSEENRITNASLVKMEVMYKYIFWKNEVYTKKYVNILCYLIRILGKILRCMFSFSTPSRIEITKITVLAYLYVLNNYKRIDTNEIDYNAFIFDEINEKQK